MLQLGFKSRPLTLSLTMKLCRLPTTCWSKGSCIRYDPFGSSEKSQKHFFGLIPADPGIWKVGLVYESSMATRGQSLAWIYIRTGSYLEQEIARWKVRKKCLKLSQKFPKSMNCQNTVLLISVGRHSFIHPSIHSYIYWSIQVTVICGIPTIR